MASQHVLLATLLVLISLEPCRAAARASRQRIDSRGASDTAASVGSVVTAPDGALTFVSGHGHVSGALAWGSYVDSLATTSNFGKLRVVSAAGQPDALQMRAAGFAEGFLTAERMYDQFTNLHSYFGETLYPGLNMTEPLSWLHDQEAWARAQVQEHQDDAQWRAVGLVLAQFDGLVEGYQARAKQELRAQGGHKSGSSSRRQQQAQGRDGSSVSVGWLQRDDLVFLNNNGDLYDIIDHMQGIKELQKQRGGAAAGVQQQRRPAGPRIKVGDVRGQGLDPGALSNMLVLAGKCSALIKVLGDLSDVLIGHSTWDSYTAALRIYKHYEFNLGDKDIVSRRLSFSSYPGELFSDDDMYISDTRLVVVETTNHIFQDHLLDSLSPLSLPSWQRIRSAFMLASSGEQWVHYFGAHNSGTYNNQYMVLDLNRFVPSQQLQPGFLWVVEQIPDLVTALDATQTISYAYWPSFNVPYFEKVYNATGYPKLIAEMEDEDADKYQGAIRWLKYQICPRAVIFRRDQGKVRSLEDMKAMMRYNNWRRDPDSASNPTYTICGRGDLQEPGDAVPKGCYDSKVTSYRLALDMEAEVVNGPSVTADGVPFSWEGRWSGPEYVHRGHPAVFDFQYERMAAGDLPLPKGAPSGKVGMRL